MAHNITHPLCIISSPGDTSAAAGAIALADHHGDGAGEERVRAAVGGARQEEEGRAVEAAPVGNKGDQAEGEGAARQRVADAQQGALGEVPEIMRGDKGTSINDVMQERGGCQKSKNVKNERDVIYGWSRSRLLALGVKIGIL